MRRSLLALTWAIGTTMAVVLAWWGVSIVDDQVVSGRDAPVQEAVDVPASTTKPPQVQGPRTELLPDDLFDGLTANLDADASALPPDIVTTPPAPSDTAATTSPPAVPTTAPPDRGGSPTRPATTVDTTPVTAPPAPPPSTTPPTTAPPANTTTTTTTTTSGGDASGAAPFPPGWDQSAGFEPKADGTSTYTFDCGSVTIHWREYRVARITGTLAEGDAQCSEQFRDARIEVREVRETDEILFRVIYRDGHVDEYRMSMQPPPAG